METNGEVQHQPIDAAPTSALADTKANLGQPSEETKPETTTSTTTSTSTATLDSTFSSYSQPSSSSAASTGVDSSSSTSSSTTTATATAAATSEEGSRKRRSRWAPTPTETPNNAPSTTNGASATSAEEDAAAARKKSRWSKPAETAANVNPVAKVLETLTPEQLEMFKIQCRIDELTRQIMSPSDALKEKESFDEIHGRARSPSPEPIYDANGQRINTRAQRYVKLLEKERQDLIEALQKINPNFRAPAGFKKIRYERKLMIPIKEYPDYNFIGMIIGPRGLTQKRMEKESGCKIVIRGKGAVKEGRANHRPQPGDDEDLHVLISGENEEMVIATTKEVEKLLVPIDESKNEHKARQLRELAVINGTLRDELICRLCGQPGHRQIQCPQRNQNWKPANIRCAICNSELHPTADCPQRFTRTADQAAKEMNDEYSEFMADLTGSGPVAKQTSQPLYLTDGGDGSSSNGPSDRGPPGGPSSSAGGGGGGGSGYIHPDRLASRGDPSSAYRGRDRDRDYDRDRDGISRSVKGSAPGDSFREFRPAHAPVAHLPHISHREGFREDRHHNAHHNYHNVPPPSAYGGYQSQHHNNYHHHHPPPPAQGGWSSHSYQPPPPGVYPSNSGPPPSHWQGPPPPGTYAPPPPPPPPPGTF